MDDKEIVLQLRKSTVNEFLQLINWNIDKANKQDLIEKNNKFLAIQLFCNFWKMLDHLVPDENLTPLRNFHGRDEMKIFFIITLLEAISTIKDKNRRDLCKKVRSFCNDYFIFTDKQKIQEAVFIKTNKDSQNITFCEFIELLYEIRSKFTHEGIFIGQFFYNRETDIHSDFHEYMETKFLDDKYYKTESGTSTHDRKSYEIKITYIDFENIVINAIKKYLMTAT